MSDNDGLNKARSAKNDEFFTQLEDIEKELKNYESNLRGKTIYCNCDDYRESRFVRYVLLNFDRLGIKRLIATCYKTRQTDLFGERELERATHFDYDGSVERITYLKGDGNFASAECIELLRQADVAISNPPFSLLQQYILLLTQYDKSFMVLGSQTLIARKNIFELFKNNKLWLGQNHGLFKFRIPDHYQSLDISYTEDEQGRKWKSLGNIVWYTNLPGPHRKFLECNTQYNPDNTDSTKHQKYDDYPECINVDKISDIPSASSYSGKIGTPLTLLTKYNKNQFELIGLDAHVDDNPHPGTGFKVNGKQTYARIIIRHRLAQKF